MSTKKTGLSERKENEIENFFKAIKSKNMKQLEKILKKKSFDTNVCDPSDSCKIPALLYSCLEYNYDIVYLLLYNKTSPVDVNGQCSNGIRPIWVGVETNNLELIKLLLSTRRCDVNYVDPISGCSPLYKAVLTNKADVVRLLIEGGADVNVTCLKHSSKGETSLMRAVQLNNTEICEILVNSLCDMNAKTSDGHTALHFAVSYSRYEICELLLRNNIKLHSATRHGVTAMTVAINQHKPLMVQLLVRYGYKVNRMFRYMQTPLQQAICLHSEDCAIALVKEGCSILRKKNLESYFKMATSEKLFRLMRLLVDVYPWFLKEKWIWQGDFPLSIYQTVPIINWLLDASATPRSLQILCRSKIFRALGKYPETKISQLKLPKKFEDYILMREHEIKVKTDEEKIYEIDCPYDCPALCDKKYCPPLDISDTDDDEYDY